MQRKKLKKRNEDPTYKEWKRSELKRKLRIGKNFVLDFVYRLIITITAIIIRERKVFFFIYILYIL